MSAYKFDDPEGIYFVTFTVVEWIDVFTRSEYSEIVLDSIRYCQKEKGLEVYAWVIMSNHIHLIISRNENVNDLSAIVRDFKKFTASHILKSIENNTHESRKNWMLWIFSSAGKKNKNNTNFQFWKQDNHAELLMTNKFMQQKLDYIHNNPVVAGLVDEPEYYKYSSASDYAGQKGLLKIKLLV
ncbi:transposase [Fulvivirga lutimaris]|nr:transposase [Fulvivirga lutimaris]MTI39268.1 transposase [Fulvivirga lutimaris]